MKWLIIFLLLFTSCAHVNRFNTWRRNSFEKASYIEAIDILESAVPKKILEKCEYKFNAPIPPTTSISSEEELIDLYGGEVSLEETITGFYVFETKEVYYLKGDWDTLTHEYLHYLNDISSSSNKERCFDHVISYLGVYAMKQGLAAKRWQKAYKRERNKNRVRR